MLSVNFHAGTTNAAPVETRRVNEYFSIDEIEYAASINWSALSDTPGWSVSQPLPFTFARAEQIARVELRKLVGDEPALSILPEGPGP